MLDGFGTVCKGLGKRTKPYLPQICGTILWRLNNKSAKVRQQAADLIARVAPVMQICQEVNTSSSQQSYLFSLLIL
jgi:splicing factor 3B subunit 1